MKAMMMFAAAAIFLFSAAAAVAQDKAYFSSIKSCEKARAGAAEKGYAKCLASANNGVVESAIAHVAMMKLALPAVEYATVARRLEDLAINGSTPVIRYKAYIAAQVFENPRLFAAERERNYADPDAMFTALAGRLQSTYLSENLK